MPDKEVFTSLCWRRSRSDRRADGGDGGSSPCDFDSSCGSLSGVGIGVAAAYPQLGRHRDVCHSTCMCTIRREAYHHESRFPNAAIQQSFLFNVDWLMHVDDGANFSNKDLTEPNTSWGKSWLRVNRLMEDKSMGISWTSSPAGPCQMILNSCSNRYGQRLTKGVALGLCWFTQSMVLYRTSPHMYSPRRLENDASRRLRSLSSLSDGNSNVSFFLSDTNKVSRRNSMQHPKLPAA